MDYNTLVNQYTQRYMQGIEKSAAPQVPPISNTTSLVKQASNLNQTIELVALADAMEKRSEWLARTLGNAWGQVKGNVQGMGDAISRGWDNTKDWVSKKVDAIGNAWNSGVDNGETKGRGYWNPDTPAASEQAQQPAATPAAKPAAPQEAPAKEAPTGKTQNGGVAYGPSLTNPGQANTPSLTLPQNGLSPSSGEGNNNTGALTLSGLNLSGPVSAQATPAAAPAQEAPTAQAQGTSGLSAPILGRGRGFTGRRFAAPGQGEDFSQLQQNLGVNADNKYGRNTQAAETSAIQKQLGINADGIYGKNTRQAVMDFQRKNGLRVDGLVGPETRAALHKNMGANSIYGAPVKTASFLVSEDKQRALQQLLQS